MFRGAVYLIALLFLATIAGFAATVVQSQACQDWANYDTVWTCTFPSATAKGNAIIVFALGYSAATVTGGTGNAYALDLNYLFGGRQRIMFFSAANANPAHTITVTFGSITQMQIVVIEVSGLATTAPLLDRTATNDNGYYSNCSGGRTFTSGVTATTSQANEFMVGWTEQAYPNVMDFTDDAPWVMVAQEPIGGSRIAYRQAISTGRFAYTGRFSGSGECDVGTAILTYKSASTGR